MTRHEEKIGDILNALAQHLQEILGSDPDGSFLYAEVDEEGYEVAIFHDHGDKITYYDADDELFDEVINLWDSALDHEKWAVLEYDVRGDQFYSNFTYADQLDPEEDSVERRQRLVNARYGDKPVIYPTLGPGAVELTPADLAHLDDEDE